MAARRPGKAPRRLERLAKCPTGIEGLDDITEGGLPVGRTTLVCGSAGSGKTLLAMEFLVRGARQYGEPGVLLSFDETEGELAQNVASIGFDLEALAAHRQLVVDTVRTSREELRESGGEYTLEGLFVRLGLAVEAVGAKRVVLDSLETLFSGLTDQALLRAELRRLFAWLKERGLTALITAERGEGALTRHGFEEYLSDCVLLLDLRVREQFATRRLRIVKYRGSRHGTDEYPFLIGAEGLRVLPITSLGLNHPASAQRLSTGLPRLDTMLGGKGYFQGSSVLVSGTAGTGKTSLAAHLVDATCRRGERCLVFLLEESANQLIRNMRSIGLDLGPWVRQGLLRIHAARPTQHGLEAHLVSMHGLTEDFEPRVVVVDPVTNLASVGTATEARQMLTRLIDYFKTRQVTAFFTSLTTGDSAQNATDVGVSSLMDTWLLVRDLETDGERNRVLYVLKSRGMPHSNQVREFRLTRRGIELIDVYVGPGGVLTGAARVAQEAREAAEEVARQLDAEQRRATLQGKLKLLEAQQASVALERLASERALADLGRVETARIATLARASATMARARFADPAAARRK